MNVSGSSVKTTHPKLFANTAVMFDTTHTPASMKTDARIAILLHLIVVNRNTFH